MWVYLDAYKTGIESRQKYNIAVRYLYDNAPKRRFLEQLDNTFVLLSGQRKHTTFGVSINFGF